MNYLEYVNSFIWVGKKTNIICSSCQLVKSIKRQTLLKLTRNHFNRHKEMSSYIYRCNNCKPSGSCCAKWKGGRVLRNGYIAIHRSLVPLEYQSMCSEGGCYVAEHRLVVAIREGRCLLAIEHVHHIDFNPLNNASDNLLLIDASSHAVITKMSKIINEQGLKIKGLEGALRMITTPISLITQPNSNFKGHVNFS